MTRLLVPFEAPKGWKPPLLTTRKNEDYYAIVKWVAVRGTIHDWAIYHSWSANCYPVESLLWTAKDCDKVFDPFLHMIIPRNRIASYGAKLHDEKKIREIMKCDDEAFKMYRH